jgi:hypothetical protein
MEKRSHGQPPLPTDRSFGFTFGVVFGLLGAWLAWRGSAYALPSVVAAAAFAIVAVVRPMLLYWPKVVWMRFGALLNKVVSPIILGAIFFVVFTPVALYFRLTGRDALRRRFDRDAKSYWIERVPPGPEGKTFERQF